MMQNATRRRRSAAGAVGPRPVGPRARIARDGAAHRHRRHVRRPVHRRVSRLRPRARRLRLHARRAAASDRGAGHLRGQGSERGLRPARRLPDPAPDALLFSWSDPVYAGADERVPAAGSEIARVTEQARALVGGARPARSHAACSRRRSSTGMSGTSAGAAAVHRLRAVGGAAAGGDDRRHDDQRGHRPRLPDPRDRLRSPRSHLQGAAGAEPARHRRCPRSRRGARSRTRARSLPRRADRAEGQHRHY